MISKTIVTIALALAAPLAFACDYPSRPDDLPDGTKASKDEMLAAVKLIGKYQDRMQKYLSCMEADQIVASQVIDESDEEAKEAKEAKEQSADMFNKKYNAAVEEQTLVVEEFNAQIRAFKESSN